MLYLSTLSKTLAPGLRIAWVVAPESVISRLVQMKQGADLHSSTFCQMVAYEVAKDGFLDRHVRTIREVYGERRNAMLAALERHFPAGGALDEAAGRPLPLDHPARGPRLDGAPQGGARRGEGGLRARRVLLPARGRRADAAG